MKNFRDQSELAANIAIGLASLDCVGVPLALVWYQARFYYKQGV